MNAEVPGCTALADTLRRGRSDEICACGNVALVSSPASFAACAAPSDPLEFYREYQSVLANAKSLDPLLPYYTKELSAGLAKMPKEMQANYLNMNARRLTDLKVTRQTVDASKAVLELTAKP